VSFGAANRSGEKVLVDADFVERHIGDLAANADLSRFIL
jgi:ATP-dependent HslUV protease ATP-binding subunit HslU